MAVQRRLPQWLKVQMPGGPNYLQLRDVLKEGGLNTVCEEAHCPNIGECWESGTATFMILGDVCTRACAYCAVASGVPGALDPLEPLDLLEHLETLVPLESEGPLDPLEELDPLDPNYHG